MNALRFFAATALALATLPASAQEPYRPQAAVSGTIRIWGHPYMAGVVRSWAESFERFHPGAKVEAKLMGSDTAIPGLYSGNADIALMGRENNVIDDMGFSRPKQYKFTRFEIMNGSLDAPGKSDALVVFVHRDNPLARLTLAELDAIVGCERRRGHAPIRTWGDLGLLGEWAARPIHVYAYDADTGTGRFFQRAVMRDSRKMIWDRIDEYKDTRRHDRSVNRAAEQILARLRADPSGIAIASLRFASADVKPVALARESGGPYVLPTRESVIARTYPLARRAYAFVDVPPGTPMDPKVREFLRYVLSREGQADVARDRGYLPLSATVIAEQRAALDVDRALPAYALRSVEAPRDAAYVSADGEVTVIGYNDMKEMLEAMAARFSAAHPRIRLKLLLPGTRFAPDALAKGESAFAPMGAELTPAQLAAYRAIRSPDPVAFRVAHASLDPKALSGPLAVFVNRDNPVRSLTLAQIARIYAGEARRWGDVGAQGEWVMRPIAPIGLADGTALFHAFRDMAMQGRAIDARMTGLAESTEVVRKVGEDPAAIGFAAAMRATDATRVLALAAREGEPAVAPTEEAIVAGRYPLDRFLLIYVAPPITPLAREFLRLALSRDGQEAVAATPQRYLPLSAADAATELRKLEKMVPGTK